jgi:hypothetical protein
VVGVGRVRGIDQFPGATVHLHGTSESNPFCCTLQVVRRIVRGQLVFLPISGLGSGRDELFDSDTTRSLPN